MNHKPFINKLLIATLWLVNCSVWADVKLPQLIGNGMVLQRDRPLTIWGWADAGEAVTIRFDGKAYAAKTGADGKWTATLPAQKAGGPHTLEIQGRNQITLTDVLVGDVWLCSGQSNMELPMARVIDRYADVIAKANYPQIRQFGAATRYEFSGPQADFSPTQWVAATPQSVLQFTAIGFFFARDLYEKYHVPIGLVRISVGGSPAEAWLSPEGLNMFPTHLATARKLKEPGYVDRIRRSDDSISRVWYTRLCQGDKGLQTTQRWYDPAYDASQWPRMNVPGYWADQGVGNVNGVVWFRRDIDVPERMAGQAARLRLGSIVDRDSVFLNGVFVGTTGYQYPPRKYPIPAGLLKAGRNTLTVRVINSSGRGGFYLDKPYQLEGPRDTLKLAGSWGYQVGTTMPALPPSTFFQYMPGGLYNAMVAPLLQTAIKGVIWYQGESNAARAGEYAQLFPALITDWRKQFGQGDFPFLFVQLANYMAKTEQPGNSDWAALREAQRQTLRLPNTAMAVAIDLGEWNDIHPLNKADVGNRLARAAERLTYGNKRVAASGPVLTDTQVKDHRAVLTFRETGSGLVQKNNVGSYRAFALADAAQPDRYVWANTLIKGDKVVLWNDAVPNPVAVRYAWADNPDATLYNADGLPASPFEVKLPASASKP